MNKLMSTLTTLGLGAGLMYFYDPRNGRRRRAQMRDQINSSMDDSREFFQDAVDDLRQRSQGLSIQARQARSKMKEAIPSTGQSGATSMDSYRDEYTPGIRLLLATGGGLLALYGRLKRGIIGSALTLTGIGIAARGISNMNTKRMLGIGNRADAVDIHKAINIDASPEEIYRFWENFENFPRFMSNIKEIRRIDDTRTHWVAEGPAGSTVEWDAITTEKVPNESIAWETTADSPVKSTGFVRFDPNNRGGTRVTVDMSYSPPAGAVGHAVATLFGKNPRQEMNEDLVRLKSLLETGKTTTEGQRVRRSDLPGGMETTGG